MEPAASDVARGRRDPPQVSDSSPSPQLSLLGICFLCRLFQRQGSCQQFRQKQISHAHTRIPSAVAWVAFPPLRQSLWGEEVRLCSLSLSRARDRAIMGAKNWDEGSRSPRAGLFTIQEVLCAEPMWKALDSHLLNTCLHLLAMCVLELLFCNWKKRRKVVSAMMRKKKGGENAKKTAPAPYNLGISP